MDINIYQPCCKPLKILVGSRCRLPSGGHIKAGAQPHRLRRMSCRMPRGQEHVTAETTVAQLKGRITSEVPCDQPVIRLRPEFVELLEINYDYNIPVVPHKAVAEVSKIGNL